MLWVKALHIVFMVTWFAGLYPATLIVPGLILALLALYNTIHHFGGIVVPPGYTDDIKFAEGNPYGVSQIDQGDTDEPLTDTASEALDHLVDRLLVERRPRRPPRYGSTSLRYS